VRARGLDLDSVGCERAVAHGPLLVWPPTRTYYFRMRGMFETSAKQYDWLNRIISVGLGNRLADGPVYSIFEVP
jgi:hypothetical protein